MYLTLLWGAMRFCVEYEHIYKTEHWTFCSSLLHSKMDRQCFNPKAIWHTWSFTWKSTPIKYKFVKSQNENWRGLVLRYKGGVTNLSCCTSASGNSCVTQPTPSTPETSPDAACARVSRCCCSGHPRRVAYSNQHMKLVNFGKQQQKVGHVLAALICVSALCPPQKHGMPQDAV